MQEKQFGNRLTRGDLAYPDFTEFAENVGAAKPWNRTARVWQCTRRSSATSRRRSDRCIPLEIRPHGMVRCR